MILPNLITLLGLCAGLTAIRMAIESRYGEAIGLIVIAAVLDAVDGAWHVFCDPLPASAPNSIHSPIS